MGENSKSVTVSIWADYLIGYERILDYFKQAQKECPKGVGLKKDRKPSETHITLQFKLGDKRVIKSCGCNLTMQGITDALKKAHLVATALESLSSETQFLGWYDDVILEKNVVKNDLMTFGEAIAKVEEKYWSGVSQGQSRDRDNPSHARTWLSTYGNFFKLLPRERIVNIEDIVRALETKERGTKTYGECLYAFKKLATTVKDESVCLGLEDIDHIQTKFLKKQNAELESFLEWRQKALAESTNRYLQNRKQWLWVASMQMIYGFRVHEVFAIQNIDKPFTTDDGVTIPPLNETGNKKMVAVVGTTTAIGTTTKTGYRLAAPMLPPSHPNLVEDLDIRQGSLPPVQLKSTNPETIGKAYAKRMRQNLESWHCPVTQTHALRHLSNQNGKQAGISIDDRAANLGHSITLNEKVYLSREHTKTRLGAIDNMSKRQLPLEGALIVLIRVGITPGTLALVSEIYGIQMNDLLSLIETNKKP